MTYRGRVKGGVVVLDTADPLPEGAVVDVALHSDTAGDESHGRAALIARGRELVRRAQERNRGVAEEVIAAEVDRAIDEVRGRGRE